MARNQARVLSQVEKDRANEIARHIRFRVMPFTPPPQPEIDENQTQDTSSQERRNYSPGSPNK